MTNGLFKLALLGAAAFFVLVAPRMVRAETPTATEVAVERIDVMELHNKASLGPEEMQFLMDVVFTAFSELPRERFDVTPVELSAVPNCDLVCAREQSLSNGASKLVVGSVAPFGNGYVASLKLYDVATGQLLGSTRTPPLPSLEGLLNALTIAVWDLRDKLEPLPRAEIPTQPVANARPAQPAMASVLRVTSEPAGARVYISRTEDDRGELAGPAPVEKNLLPLTYWITVELPEHTVVRRKVRLDPGETEGVAMTVPRAYPTSPYKLWGHVSLWTGVALVPLVAVSGALAHRNGDAYQNDLDQSSKDTSAALAGVMWVSIGASAALITTGLVLLGLNPGDKEYFEKKQSIVAAPGLSHGGMMFGYQRRF